jgi:hypothetical protein
LTLAVTAKVEANICAHDAVPAASLLFPYVVFDYSNPTSGETTLIAITNMSSQAQIVHLTLWSDISVRALDLNIVLSGYDVQTINLRDILHFSLLPVTGTEGDLLVAGGQPWFIEASTFTAELYRTMRQPETTPTILELVVDNTHKE